MHTPDNNPLWATLRRGLRLLAWPLLAMASAACSTTTRHPTSEATEVILRFTYDDGKPMRHDNYIATARQQLWTKQCSNLGGTRNCDIGLDILFMSGEQPLDAQGEYALPYAPPAPSAIIRASTASTARLTSSTLVTGHAVLSSPAR
ncbi:MULTISPECIES: hypothetical protein [unclassified Janthinobacterium]|uniref:hypothetical protein n=1 Tax=unclassified Janthinobacterium TaxID=2610881 RepID=UPI00162117E3|nr:MULTISPECIES: hypothetical protein [unclassified Janthinobacterium]MBB5369863.1 hypothetical protein [Janthinobacterium sp. K2C7]MBB5382669.1 hypothetical protein [Janthinobacterium sp. K2Li3]MBB5384654.1 hypothetical protein [Janthinobacterium sp. K2E3]